MAADSRGTAVLCMPRQWQDRETSPERNKIWFEPKSKAAEQKFPVIYYLSRNGQLEHPHFMEVPLSSPKGLYLRDVMSRLNFLRGEGMADLYSWSSKRSYKNGFVWQDLSKNGFIYPCHGHEYVLKGSQLLQTSLSFRSSETAASSSTSNISSETNSTSSVDSVNAPVIPRKKNQSWSSFRDLREYQVYEAKTVGEFAGKAANAATQTEDKGRGRGEDREEAEEYCEGSTAITELSGEEFSLAFSKSLKRSKKTKIFDQQYENHFEFRSYKNGFVWQDLSKNGFIYPCHGHEYVLKGSQLLQTSLSFRSSETAASSSTSNISSETNSTSSVDSVNAPVIPRKKNQSWSSFRDLREYQVYEAKTVGVFAGKAANAATQTEDKGRGRGEDREEAEEYCEGSTAITELSGEEFSLAFSKSLKRSMIKVDGSADTRNQTVESDRLSGRMKPSTVLMQLIRCGSIKKDQRL